MSLFQNPEFQFRRGSKVDLPNLEEAEPGFCTDTKELFIGSNEGNIQLAKKEEVDTLNSAFTTLESEVNNTIDEFQTSASQAIASTKQATADANTAADNANAQAQAASDRITELNGVDATQFYERQNQFETDLAQNTQQFTSYGIDTKLNVGQDNYQSITNALNLSNGVVTLPRGSYLTSQQIVIPPNTKVLAHGVTIKPTIGNINVIKMSIGSKLEGLTIDVSGLNYSGIALLIKADNGNFGMGTSAKTRDINIINDSNTGTGVKLQTEVSGQYISFCDLDISIKGFNEGLTLENNPSSGSWINGNVFRGVISQCKNHIVQRGYYDMSKNEYFINMQSTSGVSAIGWLVQIGDNNAFKGTMWDTQQYSDCAVKFDTGAGNNNIVFSPQGFDGSKIKNLTASNRNNGAYNLVGRYTQSVDSLAGTWQQYQIYQADGKIEFFNARNSPYAQDKLLEMNSNTNTFKPFKPLVLPDTGGLPTASSTYKKMLWIVDGAGTAPSTIYICLQNSTGGWQWVQLGTTT